MKRISIYGLKRDRKAILEMLQRAGAVEVCSEEDGDAAEEKKDNFFGKMDVSSSKAVFQKGMRDAAAFVSQIVLKTNAFRLPFCCLYIFTA